MTIPQNVLESLARLGLYNDEAYDAGSNPYGYDNGGHRINWFPALQDVARVANWFEATRLYHAGAYTAAAVYSKGAVVFDGGSAWVAIDDVPAGQAPPELPVTSNAHWVLHVSKGDKGDAGEPGITWLGAWADGTAYVVGDSVSADGRMYIATAGHTAAVENQPGTGANWGTVWDLAADKGADGTGAGDMLAATYDPGGRGTDVFSMGNMAEAAGALILTAAERAKLDLISVIAAIDLDAIQQALAALTAGLADLGTAAGADTGTGPGEVLVLDEHARLPAVDGSQLTNLPSAGAAFQPFRNMQVFTSDGTFSKPADVDRVFVTIINAGSRGTGGTNVLAGQGGKGGDAVQGFVDLTADAPVVIGQYPGGDSLFDGRSVGLVASTDGFRLAGAVGGTSGGSILDAFGGSSGYGGTYGRGGDAKKGPVYPDGTDGAVIVMW